MGDRKIRMGEARVFPPSLSSGLCLRTIIPVAQLLADSSSLWWSQLSLESSFGVAPAERWLFWALTAPPLPVGPSSLQVADGFLLLLVSWLLLQSLFGVLAFPSPM